MAFALVFVPELGAVGGAAPTGLVARLGAGTLCAALGLLVMVNPSLGFAALLSAGGVVPELGAPGLGTVSGAGSVGTSAGLAAITVGFCALCEIARARAHVKNPRLKTVKSTSGKVRP